MKDRPLKLISQRESWLTLIVMFAMFAFPSTSFAQWVSVGDGIDYQEFNAAGPNRLFVSRMDRSNPNATIDTTIANGTISGAKEIVRSQVERQDDAITWWGGSWGARNGAVIGINGGFYNTTTGVIEGGQIQSGWYAHWFADRGAFSGFAWKTDRTAFHGECIDHTPTTVYVKFMSNSANQTIDGVNITPANNNLIIFTPQYNTQTPTGTRTEVLVEMSRPTLTTSGTGYSSGIIKSIQQNTGSTWIPFDHIVLSGLGNDATALGTNAVVGSEVRIFQELTESNEPTVQGTTACQTNTGVNWANVFASINTNYHFLENNVVRVPDAVTHPGYIGYVNLNPRTAICWNTSYVFFVVCDGRSTISVGMSCETLGNWAKSALGATDGVNLDGGGSSTMLVNGTVKNVVSDGSERAVCNGIMMVNVLPKQQSGQFTNGQTVYTAGVANRRLGPGTNYGIMNTIAAGAQGAIVSHALNGVYAKGYYWWKCDFGGSIGWVAESLLTSNIGNVPLNITQQPSNQIVGIGGTVHFSVVAVGTGALSYQWQKNQVDLANTGHYSAVTTPTLTITSADNNDAANYRCVVSDSVSSTISSEAALSVVVCPVPSLVNANFEGANTGGVANGWTGYQRPTNPTTVWSIQTASPPSGGGLQYQQIANTSASGGGGIRQDITGCTIGTTYTIAGWMRTNSASATCTVKCSPSASTDWATALNLSPTQTTTSNAWVPFSGTITATGTSMTLWLDGQTGGTGLNKASCFDSITVTPSSLPPTPVISATSPVCANSTGNIATITNPAGCAYTWSISGGTIAAGAGTNSITYTAGTGASLTLMATQTANGGTSAQGSKIVSLTALVPADFDSDCDVDADDADHLIGCLTGPQVSPPEPGCQNADLDQDNDIDQTDFGMFQRCYSGAGTPANAACAQ